MSLCVAGLYAGPWFVGSVFKASSERSVPSGISAVMWERYVSSASSRLSLTLSVLQKRDQKNSSWEGDGINALCQLIGQWVTDSLYRGIDLRKEIDLWLLHIITEIRSMWSMLLFNQESRGKERNNQVAPEKLRPKQKEKLGMAKQPRGLMHG